MNRWEQAEAEVRKWVDAGANEDAPWRNRVRLVLETLDDCRAALDHREAQKPVWAELDRLAERTLAISKLIDECRLAGAGHHCPCCCGATMPDDPNGQEVCPGVGGVLGHKPLSELYGSRSAASCAKETKE